MIEWLGYQMPIRINLETVYNIKGSVFVRFRYNTPLVSVLSMGSHS